jgi:hypothetical protein
MRRGIGKTLALGGVERISIMNPEAQRRRPAVLKLMDTIRQVFSGNGYDVDAYTNEEIADSLLELCPLPTDYWLSLAHLAATVQRLAAQRH